MELPHSEPRETQLFPNKLLVIAAGVFALSGAIALGYVLVWGTMWNGSEEARLSPSSRSGFTEEEKREILRVLASTNEQTMSESEKGDILQTLTQQRGTDSMRSEEKLDALGSLRGE